MPDEKPHAHHWVVETPEQAESRWKRKPDETRYLIGKCKLCKAVKNFPAKISDEAYYNNNARLFDHLNDRLAKRPVIGYRKVK